MARTTGAIDDGSRDPESRNAESRKTESRNEVTGNRDLLREGAPNEESRALGPLECCWEGIAVTRLT
jgi:hypothetical protein